MECKFPKLKKYLVSGEIKIITSNQLLSEIKLVTSREKLKKYFPEKTVNELLELLDIIAEKVVVTPIHNLCRDPKDNFLLDLIDQSKADYLETGDKDLLDLNPFKTAQIVSPKVFEIKMSREF